MRNLLIKHWGAKATYQVFTVLGWLIKTMGYILMFNCFIVIVAFIIDLIQFDTTEIGIVKDFQVVVKDAIKKPSFYNLSRIINLFFIPFFAYILIIFGTYVQNRWVPKQLNSIILFVRFFIVMISSLLLIFMIVYFSFHEKLSSHNLWYVSIILFIAYSLTFLLSHLYKSDWQNRFQLYSNGYGNINCIKDKLILDYPDFLSKEQILDIIRKKDAPKHYYSKQYDFIENNYYSVLDSFDKYALWKFSNDFNFVYTFMSHYPELVWNFYMRKIKLKNYSLINNKELARSFIDSIEDPIECCLLMKIIPDELKNNEYLFNRAFTKAEECIVYTKFINEKKYVLIALSKGASSIYKDLSPDLAQDEEVQSAYSNALEQRKKQGAAEGLS